MQTYLNNLTILDIAIVISHLVICIGIGFYHFKNIKTAQDFCTVREGKALPTILVCTIFATAIGGGTIVGYIDEIYKKDKEIVLAALKYSGNALRFAHEDLKKDKEILKD